MADWEIRDVRVSDTREVTASVSGMPPLYTAKGNRPIDPFKVQITYHLGRGWVFVEVRGKKLFEERKHSRYDNPVTTRRYDASKTELPQWITTLIEEHRPVEEEGWWR